MTDDAANAGSELISLDAAEITRRVRERTVTAGVVVDAHIARIEAVDSALNAVPVANFEDARNQAAKELSGPLAGVPITIKEAIDVAGLPTSAGIEGRDAPARESAPAVQRLTDAGAVVVGKTNLAQLLLYHESDNPRYGRTNNPWDHDRTPGGSSGGEAAIIAAGGSVLGIGSDIGGSIRVPAHFCGIHGLKPTYGTIPNDGTYDASMFPGIEPIRGSLGPLARTVADLRTALTVASGKALWDERVEVSRLKIGFYTDDGYMAATPAIRRVVGQAAAALREAGAEVVEFTPPDVTQAFGLYYRILSSDGGRWIKEALGKSKVDRRVKGLLQLVGIPGWLSPAAAGTGRVAGQRRLSWLIGVLGRLEASEYQEACRERDEYRQRFLDQLDAEAIDVLICPPHPLPALLHGTDYWLGAVSSYARLYNLVDFPAGVVAASRTRAGEESDRATTADLIERTARKVEAGSTGMPVGVQVAARPQREDLVLAAMETLEGHFRSQPDYPTPAPM